MSVEREMSLAEWCAKLPNQHKVNQELAVLNKQLAALTEQNKQLKAELKSIDGALNDPRANLTLTTSEIIWELKEQIERLTDAYDQCGRTVQEYGRAIDQTESRLREVAAHCANVEQQLAAPTPPVSEDRKDAERYRWLCETATEAQWVEFGGYTNKQHIDNAIDAAMQEDKR